MLQKITGVLMFTLSFVIFALIIRLWPIAPQKNGDVSSWDGLWTCAPCDNLPFEPKLIIIVLLCGALGSAVHAATSFATYVGNRSFVNSWAWWYFLRIPIGMGLAGILYFALRGGFFSPVSNGSVHPQDIVNPFGFAAIAALAGMFSKQATDKLKEIFDNLFRTDENSQRTDKLGKFAIETVEPTQLVVSQANPVLTVTGKGLTAQLKVTIASSERDYDLNADKMTICLKEADVASPGDLELKIFHPERDQIATRNISIVEGESAE